MIAGIGLMMLLLGIALMDSEVMALPIALVIIGLAILVREGSKSETSINDYTRGHNTSFDRR